MKKMSDKLKSHAYRAKKNNSSILRLDGGVVQSGSASISSNVNESYVSVSAANPNRDEPGRRSAQDQSFNSHQSKKSRTHKRDVSAKRAATGVQDKENNEVAVISTTPKTMNEAFDAT
jgi:hypothetical protein